MFPTRTGVGSHMKTHSASKTDKAKPAPKKKQAPALKECIIINAGDDSSDDD